MDRRLGLALALVVIAGLATLGVVFLATPPPSIESQEDAATNRTAKEAPRRDPHDVRADGGADDGPAVEGGQVISGRVVNADDKPLIGALVIVTSSSRSSMPTIADVPVDMSFGDAMEVDPDDVEPGIEIEEVEEIEEIESEVFIDYGGRSAARAIEFRAETRTDEQGRFSFEVPPDARYEVEARVTGLTRGREYGVAPGRRDLLLRLHLGARVRGSVMANGEGPLNQASVRGPGADTLTDRDGRFLLDGLNPMEGALNALESRASPSARTRARP